jgi:hypothetical protein
MPSNKKRKEIPATTASSSEGAQEETSMQTLSSVFKDRRLRLSEDRLSVTGSQGVGYQSVCSVYSAYSGKWYFEITVEDLHDSSHFRVGWSTRRTRFDQPIGSDCFSYAIRDSDCCRISLGKRWDYGNRKITQGDVIGCLIDLPAHPTSPKLSGDPLTFFSDLLCDPENVQAPDLLGEAACVEWTVNGERLGVGFVNLVSGEYYPSVSVFSKVRLRMNFGPTFTFHPGDEYQPCTAMYIPKELIRPKKRPANFIPRGLTSGS